MQSFTHSLTVCALHNQTLLMYSLTHSPCTCTHSLEAATSLVAHSLVLTHSFTSHMHTLTGGINPLLHGCSLPCSRSLTRKPCTCTQAPVSLTVNLGRACNVERIIVRAFHVAIHPSVLIVEHKSFIPSFSVLDHPVVLHTAPCTVLTCIAVATHTHPYSHHHLLNLIFFCKTMSCCKLWYNSHVTSHCLHLTAW
jgi:hypothetical protein